MSIKIIYIDNTKKGNELHGNEFYWKNDKNIIKTNDD